MVKRFFIFFFLLGVGGFSWYAQGRLSWPGLEPFMRSAFSLAALYALMEIFLRTFVAKRIQDARSAYRFRKTVDILFYIFATLVLFRIWIENPEALIVSYGIVAAGAAIALQDLIKNMAGGVVVLLNNLFRVGDRIAINDMIGDVIDIGVFNTTMFEIGNWVGGDQATGRITTVPNGAFLSNHVVNYTRDHEFIWDEIIIPVSYDSDWKKAKQLFLGIAKRRTKSYVEPANQQLKRMARKFYVSERDSEPTIFVRLTDNWIELHIRFITLAKDRRAVSSDIMTSILKSVQGQDEIQIASETLDIIGFKKSA